MSDFTPTTEQVRDGFRFGHDGCDTSDWDREAEVALDAACNSCTFRPRPVPRSAGTHRPEPRPTTPNTTHP